MPVANSTFNTPPKPACVCVRSLVLSTVFKKYCLEFLALICRMIGLLDVLSTQFFLLEVEPKVTSLRSYIVLGGSYQIVQS